MEVKHTFKKEKIIIAIAGNIENHVEEIYYKCKCGIEISEEEYKELKIWKKQ